MFFLKNCCFIHLPKTGGFWCSTILEKEKLIVAKTVHRHHVLQTSLPCFAFVRNPETWVCSMWSHRERRNWNWNQSCIERACKSTCFEQWIENIIRHPSILNEFVWHYLKSNQLIIGKTETLAIDLSRILKMFGYNADETITLTPPNHVTPNRKTIPQDLLADFRQSQRDFYQLFEYQ